MTRLDRRFFEGEALSIDGLVEMLLRQGLVIEDEARARQILENVSYTRLKAYLVPLMEDRSTHRYKPGATFESAYALYGFDRRFRELVFHETEKIEISVRARCSLLLSPIENGLWYINPKYFKNKSSHGYFLRRLMQETGRSDNDALKSFNRKYNNAYPPSWLVIEAMSMGSLSVLYEELAPGEMKTAIAAYYGLEPQDFQNWLQHIVYVRNTCAHHNRLWNKDLKVCATFSGRHRGYFPKFNEQQAHTIYCTLCMIKYLQNTIKPCNTFSERLKALIHNFPLVNPKLMGFPDGWEKDPLWK